MARAIWNNFNGGLANEILESRYNLEKYPSLAKVMLNFLPQLHGSAKRRMGTKFVASVDASANSRIIPFIYNNEVQNNFVLLFDHLNIKIYGQYGYIATIASPYMYGSFFDISYSQVGDIVYLAHKDYPLYKIVRTGSAPSFTWNIYPVVFNASLAPPASGTATFISGPVSEGQTVAPADYTISYKITAVDANGIESVGSATFSTQGRYATDWISGDKVNLSWAGVAGAVEYNIYKESTGYYGYIATASGTTFTDQNYEADLTKSIKEDWFPFANGNNPVTVGFHNQRMVIGGTKNSPQTFYMSRAGDFENFRKSRPLQDDDPVEFTIATGTINEIQWLASFGDLLIGTSGAEYKISGSGGTGTPVTASDISIVAQSYYGSAKIDPILIGSSIVHVQQHRSKIRDLYYSLERDGYAGNDKTILAPNIFGSHKLKQWTYQQTPNSTLWCVREDGKLFSFTYMQEQNIYAWAEHETDGSFESVCSVVGNNGTVVYCLVWRNGKLVLEHFAEEFDDKELIDNAWFLDSAVYLNYNYDATECPFPPHLDASKAVMLLDGEPYDSVNVESGVIKLPKKSRTILVGYPYKSLLSMMPFNVDTQQGSTLGLQRTVAGITCKVYRSVAGKYGNSDDFDKMQDFKLLPEHYDKAYEPFSGEHKVYIQNPSRTEEQIYFGQNNGLPLEIMSIIADIKFNEKV